MRTDSLNPNSASKSLDIKETQQRVSKTNEGLIFVHKFVLKEELESNKGLLHGNYKTIIDVKRTYLISRSAWLKKITYAGKSGGNIFFRK